MTNLKFTAHFYLTHTYNKLHLNYFFGYVIIYINSYKERTTMIYTELTRKAMKISYNAHHGQLDKSGIPYIFHPFHLAEQMKDEYTICAALLHDVVEDTDVTLKELEAIFPFEVTEAVRLLTHNKDTDYSDYVRAIGTNRIARTVKLADLMHNSDKSRLDGTQNDPETARRLEKYAKAIMLLTEDE